MNKYYEINLKGLYDKTQRRKYKVGDMHMNIRYSNTTDEYYKKLKVLRAVMDNWAKQNRNLSIDSSDGRRYGEDCDKLNEMKTLLQISTSNFDNVKAEVDNEFMKNELNEFLTKLNAS